jgi:sulfite reductase (ferredoxin)
MSKLDVEALKRESGGLRGTIPDELQNDSDHFSDGSIQLLKYHGVYQQDDRDGRKTQRETGAGRDFSCMIRTKSPGGYLPADFYLAVDKLSDLFGNHSIRITTRGALQLHGVRKSNLHEVIHQMNAHLGSTLAACGDINRNVMATPFPLKRPDYQAARDAAFAIAAALTPTTKAYYEIWQDGELAHSTKSEPVDEPIYGPTYLPRKFKIGVTVPGDNSVDLYTNDVGVVPIVAADGTLEGYNITAGGGLGMTHGKHATYPRLGDEFAFVTPEQLIPTLQAIVIVQRDHGDRTNRKHARLKYTIDDRGIAWFRSAVEAQAGFPLAPWHPLPAWAIPEYQGWAAQGDGNFFYALDILSGRIADVGSVNIKSALREIVEQTGRNLVATPNQSMIVLDVSPEQRKTIDAILAKNGVTNDADLFEQRALACPALPTCGLALAEAERFLPALLGSIRQAWQATGLREGVPTIRMTGCPNSCARPTLAEIGIVGTSLNTYHLYVGGNAASTRLNTVYRENVKGEEIAGVLSELFRTYATDQRPGEGFGDFCSRTNPALVSA